MSGALKNLMQGLYYPAVTGTGLVLVLFRVTMHDSLQGAFRDYALIYGVLLVLWFSLSFVSIGIYPEEEYSLFEFVLDLLEVGLTFGMFYFLGLFSTDVIHDPNLRGMYGLIALATVVQALWRLFWHDSFGLRLWYLRVALFGVGVAGWVILHRYSVFNFLAVITNIFLLFGYYRIIAKRVAQKINFEFK